MTMRLSASSLAGTARTLVAVGSSSEAVMFLAMAFAAPRSGVVVAPPPSCVGFAALEPLPAAGLAGVPFDDDAGAGALAVRRRSSAGGGSAFGVTGGGTSREVAVPLPPAFPPFVTAFWAGASPEPAAPVSVPLPLPWSSSVAAPRVTPPEEAAGADPLPEEVSAGSSVPTDDEEAFSPSLP
jgi:hypothetical protein